MKKFDLGQAIGILANVGVIAGIVFLGIELRQNTESLAATVRASRAASSQGSFSPILQSPELAEALAHANGGDAESLMLTSYYQHTLIGWQYSWGEYRAGALEEDDLPVRGWIISITGNPAFESHWARAKASQSFDPEFVEYIDSHLEEFRKSQ